MPNSRILLKLVFLVALWSRPSDAQSPTQHWVGRQLAESSSQALILNLTTSPDMKGTVDLAEFGVSGIPASNLAVRSGNIHFELVGDSSTAVFDGTIRGELMQGSWKEDAHTGRFELHLQPVGPPLIEKSETFANGDVHLSGSLLAPRGKGPFPAVVGRIRYFPEGLVPGEPWSFGKFASGYLDLVTSWVKAENASSISPAPAVTH